MAKPPALDPKGRAWALLLTAHAALVERVAAALAAAGLPPLEWYDVLWELEKADAGRLRMHDLARRVVLSRSNLTRLADRLADERLIVREACPEDRRGAYCVITPAGRELRQRTWPVYREVVETRFARHVSASEAETIGAALERVLRADRDRAGAPASAGQRSRPAPISGSARGRRRSRR
jgi:DNA-binding MarR family transcriptional regulator